MAPQVKLRWRGHRSSILSSFNYLLSRESLLDVTLACDGQYLRAHRLVLSACSPFFEDILTIDSSKHPIIFLRDAEFVEVKALIDYMYRGEVNISKSHFASFVRLAQTLRIKGLEELEPTEAESRIDNNGKSNQLSQPLLPQNIPVKMEMQKNTRELPGPSSSLHTEFRQDEGDGEPDTPPELPLVVNLNDEVDQIARFNQSQPGSNGFVAGNHFLDAFTGEIGNGNSNPGFLNATNTRDTNFPETWTSNERIQESYISPTPIPKSQKLNRVLAQSAIPRRGRRAKFGRFGCPNTGCERFYSQKSSLQRHMQYECKKEPQFACRFCGIKSKLKGNAEMHERRCKFRNDLV